MFTTLIKPKKKINLYDAFWDEIRIKDIGHKV